MTYLKNFKDVVFLIVLVALFGCTSTEEKRAMCNDEIKGIYNDYIDEITSLSEAEITAICDQAIEKFPDLAIAYEMKGLVFQENNNLKMAWENYQKAVQFAPSDADTLANAQEVAFAFKGIWISVDESGNIQSVPFQDISLEEYAQCADGVRHLWCTVALNIRPNSRETTMFVDQSGKEIEDVPRMTFGMTYQFDSPSELDRRLILKANADPELQLHKATFLITMGGASYERID